MHEHKLFILPFDHRGSMRRILHIEGADESDTAKAALRDAKHLIYEAYLEALEKGLRKEESAILVDEEYGKEIHEDAREKHIQRILTVEKTGGEEFDFQYGSEFKEHIQKWNPEYVKALLHFHPHAEKEVNDRQIERLKTLNDFCKADNRKLLIEFLVPARAEDLEKAGGTRELFESQMRGSLMCESINMFHKGGAEPDIWKVEGLRDTSQMERVAQEARTEGRNAFLVILGRDESKDVVHSWIESAAQIPAVIGFAIGRTIFEDPMTSYRNKQLSRDAARTAITEGFMEYVEVFENARKRN